MPRPVVLALAIAAVLVGGCGDSRSPAPSLTHPALPQRFRTLDFPRQGLRIAVPAGWTLAHPHRPLVMIAASGNAIVALWRYIRRVIPPPTDSASLDRARLALIVAARAKQPHMRLLGSRTLEIDGHPAVVLEAIERIAGLERRVRSFHVYAPREEVVLEEYAPVGVFPLVSRRVFIRVRHSLSVGTP